jgi:hypothetical protein
MRKSTASELLHQSDQEVIMRSFKKELRLFLKEQRAGALTPARLQYFLWQAAAIRKELLHFINRERFFSEEYLARLMKYHCILEKLLEKRLVRLSVVLPYQHATFLRKAA